MRRDQRSAAARVYRRLYSTARWRRTRDQQLRDHPLCWCCEANGFTVRATICNHTDPTMKESEATFFDGPFDSQCKDCHDGPTQSAERAGKTSKRVGYSKAVGRDGIPMDPRHPWFAG